VPVFFGECDEDVKRRLGQGQDGFEAGFVAHPRDYIHDGYIHKGKISGRILAGVDTRDGGSAIRGIIAASTH
jgi:hypothetical protein